MTHKNIVVLLAVYAIISTLGWVYYSAQYDVAKEVIIFNKSAINSVDNYIDRTADTGEMDDFLESPEGKDYVRYSEVFN